MKPTIGAVVPVLDKRGGVRRFLEVGNILVDRGYDYTVFTNEGEANKLDWFNFNGKLADWRYGVKADKLIIGDPGLLPHTDKMEGQKFVWVIAGGEYKNMYLPYYGKFPFMVNNRHFLKDYPEAFLCEGGIDTKHFISKKRRILFYSGGAMGLSKQGHVIHEQLSGIPGIELVELKGLSNDELVRAYHSGDYFVSWEVKDWGYSNTSAEALACGLPVVTNGNNCEPFLDKVIVVKNLREFFTNPVGHVSWEIVVDSLLKIIL